MVSRRTANILIVVLLFTSFGSKLSFLFHFLSHAHFGTLSCPDTSPPPSSSGNASAGSNAAAGADAAADAAFVNDAFENWNSIVVNNRWHPNRHPAGARAPLSRRERELLARLDDYAAFHRRVQTGEAAPRFLKCPLANGWGNKFQQTVSCLLVGLETQRAVVWDKHIWATGTFEHLDTPIDANNKERLPTLKEHPELWRELGFFDIQCDDFRELGKRKNATVLAYVHPEGFDYSGGMLWNNRKVDLMRRLPGNWFSILHNWLFRPNERLVAKLRAAKEEIGWSNFTICVQIRLNNEVDRVGHLMPSAHIYFQAADNVMFGQNDVDVDDVRVFLTTEGEDYVRKAEAYYGDKLIHFRAGKNRDHGISDLVNYYLFGECAELIGTEMSSYAHNAFARVNKAPLLCNGYNFCSRKMLAQPIQYVPYHPRPLDCDKTLFSSVDNSGGYWKWVYEQARKEYLKQHPNAKP